MSEKTPAQAADALLPYELLSQMAYLLDIARPHLMQIYDAAGVSYIKRVDEVLTKYRSTPAATPASEGWQPIETAPKDGKAILIYCGLGEIDIACWHPERDGFVDYYFKQRLNTQLATHWQPLPAAPKHGEPA